MLSRSLVAAAELELELAREVDDLVLDIDRARLAEERASDDGEKVEMALELDLKVELDVGDGLELLLLRLVLPNVE